MILVDLSSNKLSKLKPGVFKALSELKKLNLSKNELQVIDGGLFNTNDYIRYLNLNGNQIEALAPDVVRKFRKLKIKLLMTGKCAHGNFDTEQYGGQLTTCANLYKNSPSDICPHTKKYAILSNSSYFEIMIIVAVSLIGLIIILFIYIVCSRKSYVPPNQDLVPYAVVGDIRYDDTNYYQLSITNEEYTDEGFEGSSGVLMTSTQVFPEYATVNKNLK